jgi:hypothetical protein
VAPSRTRFRWAPSRVLRSLDPIVRGSRFMWSL